jgi:hypothetical protein
VTSMAAKSGFLSEQAEKRALAPEIIEVVAMI